MRKPIRSLTFLGNRLVENKKNLPVCSDGDIVLLAKVAQFLLLEVGVELDLKVHSFFFRICRFFYLINCGLNLGLLQNTFDLFVVEVGDADRPEFEIRVSRNLSFGSSFLIEEIMHHLKASKF